MTKATRETLLTILYLFFGLAGATLAGYLTIGHHLFKDPNILFRFAVVGFSGSLIYSSIRLRGLGFAVLMILLFFFGQLSLTPPLTGRSAVNAALWTLPIGILFAVAAYIFGKLRRVPIGRFLIMALLAGAGYGAATVVFLLKDHSPILFRTVFGQAYAGLKVGGLVGIGIEIVELLTRGRAWHEPEAPDAAY